MTAEATVLALSRRVLEFLPGAPGRRAHIAQTLAQLSAMSVMAAPITMAQLGCGYQALGSLSSLDDGIRNRRATCKELYSLCKSDGGTIPMDGAREALEKCARLWLAWVEGTQYAQDPRLQAMCLTFRRELAELLVAVVDATDDQTARNQLARLGAS